MTQGTDEGGAPAEAVADLEPSGDGHGVDEGPFLEWLPLDTITDFEFNRDPGDLKALKHSIEENGLITPLACTPDRRLLAGRRRFAVLRELGCVQAPFLIIEPEDEAHAFRIMLDENVRRKPFTDPEYAGLIKQFHDLHQTEAEGLLAANDPQTIIEAKEQQWSQIDTAEALGVSQPTVSQAIQVADLVEQHPDWVHLKGKQILREAKIQQQIAEIEQGAERPDGLFDVIVCDPPWPSTGGLYDPEHRRGDVPPYPTMELKEIAALEVPAAENCILWLWGINRLLDATFDVARSWGFEPKTVLTWVKDKFGTGRWLRGQTEHVVLAIKGKIPWKLTNQSTVIHGPLREHSRKPDEFYALVDSLCHGRKLDMFSRQKREGWEQGGDECDKF